MVTLDAPEASDRYDQPHVRTYQADDLPAVSELLDRCGGRLRIRRGAPVDAATLPGLVCAAGSIITGVVTWRRSESELEIVVLAADEFDEPTRSELLAAVPTIVGSGPRRVVAVVENSDLAGQRSLQLAGFALCAIRPGSVARARHRLIEGRLPGEYGGIPMRDELEFELQLR